MVKPIIYGIDTSPAVRSVLLTAHAIGLDFEFKEISVQKNQHKTEEFLKKNPQHTVPALEDDGKCIWDSHAINTYLAGKYAKDDSLYPKDLYTRAVVDQRLHFDSSVLSPRMFGFAAANRSRNPEQIENSKTKLYEAYGFLETFVGENQFMVSNTMTVADFAILAAFSTINALVPADPEKYPKLNAWFQRMKALPFYEKANNVGLQKNIVHIKGKLAELAELN